MQKAEWKKFWKSKIQEKLKLLLWRIVWKSLPAWEILNKRFPIPDLCCPICGEEEETIEHIFIRCPITVQVWANSTWPLNIRAFKDMNIDQWIKVLINPGEILRIQGGEAMEFSIVAAVLCDQFWMNRNKAVWGNQSVDSVKLFNQINKVFIQREQALQLILGKKENSSSASPSRMDQI